MNTSKYIPRRLSWKPDKDSSTQYLNDSQLTKFDQPQVILGQPGMGKTRLMEKLGQTRGCQFIRASSFLRQDNSSINNGTRLVIDGLDEVAAFEQGDPLHNVLKNLANCGKPQFILSCRSAEWRSVAAKSDIFDDYGVDPVEFSLEPFTREDAIEFLTEDFNYDKTINVLDRLDTLGIPNIYKNPLTLQLVSSILVASDNIPNTRAELYSQATNLLRFEHNPRQFARSIKILSEDEALDAAGAAMAILVLTGKDALVRRPRKTDQSALVISELGDLANKDDIDAILRSNLFKQYSDYHFKPLHRTIAEFLGARWLTREIGKNEYKNRTVTRLYGLISVYGSIAASLRGLHAWLAYFSPNILAPKVISADPYGVLLYGDADHINLEQARLLLTELKNLSVENPYFRYDDFRRVSAKGLVQKELYCEIRQILINPKTEVHLRTLLLECAKGSSLLTQLTSDLRELVLNSDRAYMERLASSEALTEFPEKIDDWPKFIRELIKLQDENSTKLAINTLQKLGLDLFDNELVADAVIAESGINLENHGEDRITTFGLMFDFANNIPNDRIVGILDELTIRITQDDQFQRDYRKARNEIADFVHRLIAKQISIGPLTARQMWNWLQSFPSLWGYRTRDKITIVNHLLENDEMRRGVQKRALEEASSLDELHRKSIQLKDVSSALQITENDARSYLKEISIQNNTKKCELWKFLLFKIRRCKGKLDKNTLKLARQYATGDQELLDYLNEILHSDFLSDWEKEAKRYQSENEKKQKRERSEIQKLYSEHVEELRAGELRWIIDPAKLYLKMFIDSEPQSTPNDRLEFWLGKNLSNAALLGFEAVLHRDDIPSAEQIANSYARNKVWNFVYPMIVGAAERINSGKGLDDLPTSLISAIAIAADLESLGMYDGINKLRDSLHSELRKRGNNYELFIRQKFEPSLREKQTHVNGLLSFTQSINERPISTRLASEWLSSYQDLPLTIEMSLVDCIFCSSQEGHEDIRIALLTTIKNRLTAEVNDEKRKFWISVYFLLDFHEAIRLIPPITIDNRDWFWSLTDRFLDTFDRGFKTLISVIQLKWTVENFRSVWPLVERPRGVTRGTNNAWNATERILLALNKLATDVSNEAVRALGELRNWPEDGYTIHIHDAIARQRRARLESNFTPLSFADIRAILTNEPPRSAADVQSIVLDALEELQKRLRGDSLNLTDLFYDDSSKPRTEQECRDRLLILLENQLPFDITSHREASMPSQKRSDVAFVYNQFSVPLETKGQWHRDVWTAATTQLDKFYAIDYKAESRGIYVVFWFGQNEKIPPGKKLKLPPPEIPKPRTPEEMKSSLISLLPDYRRSDIAIVVLDVSRTSD